ncbi:hypothetical protein F383_37359 [Gossypium arboreum]|uniref:Uncharacterized protein n=1 Tax=Gossypium arboreum TaxID=29729 RepID=A0A0B0MCC4_GOSAR|nr:hypothetical protein F383_37359 [Gossypium arboreum]
MASHMPVCLARAQE